MINLKEFIAQRLQQPVGVWVLLAGALMTLGFAPFNLWPLAIVSLAILYRLVLAARSKGQVFGAAVVWGMGHQLTALYWLPWAFYKDADESLLAAIGGGVPALVGLAFYGAVGYALVALATWYAPKAKPVVFVAGWVLIEMLKGMTPFGFPWLPVGAVWAGSPPLMQLASVGGVQLLSVIILSLAVLVSRPVLPRVALASLLVTAVGIFGVMRIPAGVDDTGPVVRMVQPNIQSPHKWNAAKRWEFLHETLDTAFGKGPLPATTVMPETAVAFYLDMEDEVRSAVGNRLPKGGNLVTGTVRREDFWGPVPHFFNSMMVETDKSEITGVYDKHLLVPFGEFIPLRGLIERLPISGIRTISQSRLDYTHGVRDPRLVTNAGVALGLICYEGIFPWFVAAYSEGATYLVNITNDNWFTGTIALYQHAALARLRAVETGLPLVRVANTGLSVMYDGYGREMARMPINTAATVDAHLPLPLQQTIFVKLVRYFSL